MEAELFNSECSKTQHLMNREKVLCRRVRVPTTRHLRTLPVANPRRRPGLATTSNSSQCGERQSFDPGER